MASGTGSFKYPNWKPHLPSLLIVMGTATVAASTLSSGLQFPAILQCYSRKSVASSCGNQGTPLPLDTTKPASHSPCLFTLFLSAAPVRPCVVCGVLLPWAVSILTGTLLSISSVQLAGVRCAAISMSLGRESFLHHQGRGG